MSQFRSVAGLELIMAAESEERFAASVEALSAALGHADRRGPFLDYCLGLLMPVDRKSVEPLAAVTALRQRHRDCVLRCVQHIHRESKDCPIHHDATMGDVSEILTAGLKRMNHPFEPAH